MRTHINPNIVATSPPPVMQARRWVDGITFPKNRPLINVSQAAPMAPPPLALRQALAEMVISDTDAHLYGPVLGLPVLRSEIADKWSAAYGGAICKDRVAITSGCNQAFTATLTTLAGPGDQVILPTPWYFNHKMHLDMQGVQAVPLATDAALMPDPDHAASLITDKTRAIVLVTPNNPGGVEYPAELLQAFYNMAQRHNIALILDETYRDFDSRNHAPHDLFSDPDWDQTLIQLYSFSKAYRLTGHRVGAVVAAKARLTQIEKYLDTVTICPNQIAQRAALWGMQNLGQWLAAERDEILSRRAAIASNMHRLPEWQLVGLGAYFAYLRHPFDIPSDELAPQLVRTAGVLLLPGTMFRPLGDATAKQELRIAFANIDSNGVNTLFSRLENLAPPAQPE